MAGETMTLISTQTIASGTATTISFSSIPQTFTDLYLLLSVRDNRAFDGNPIRIGINNNGYNATRRQLFGSGSAVSSSNASDGWFAYCNGGTSTANSFSNVSVHLPNYATSVTKTYLSDSVFENNAGTGYDIIYTGDFGLTAAISSIQIGSFSTGAFVQYSSVSLYGILKGSGGATIS